MNYDTAAIRQAARKLKTAANTGADLKSSRIHTAGNEVKLALNGTASNALEKELSALRAELSMVTSAMEALSTSLTQLAGRLDTADREATEYINKR